MSKGELSAFLVLASVGDQKSFVVSGPMDARRFRSRLQYECLKSGKKTKTKMVGDIITVMVIE